MDLRAITPELMLAVLGLGLLVIELVTGPGEKRVLGWVGILGLLLAVIPSVGLLTVGPHLVFSETYAVDPFAALFKIVAILSGVLVLGAAMEFFQVSPSPHEGDVYCLVVFAVLGLVLMAAAADLILLFLAIEFVSLVSYVLAGSLKTDPKSNEAGVKYFLYGAVASAVMLYGFTYLYGVGGTTNLYRLAGAVARAPVAFQVLAVGLVLAGLGFKVSLVPFHQWTPDVYEGAPTSITAFMSVGAKAAGFAAFLRVFVTALPAVQAQATSVLAVIAALTMIVGNVVAIVQPNIKRLLAYSSIAHAGYLMVGLTAATLGAARGVSSVLFYAFAYTVTNLGAFAVVLALRRRGEEVLELDDYAGLGFKYPVLGALMSLFMLSLAGIPPTVGFLGKLYLFTAAIETGRLTWLVVLGVLTSVVSVYYYLRVIVMMYMAPAEVKTEETQLAGSGYLYAALGLTGLATLLFGILPAGILQSAAAAFESVRQFTALR